MAHAWRRPGVIMTAYLMLFLLAGPWPVHAVPVTARALAHDVSPPAVAALLSWWVARGGAVARGLILLWTAAGFATLFVSPAMRSGSLVPFWLLVAYACQMALLVSTPVYDRTRKDSARRHPGRAAVWLVPPAWLLAAAVVAGALCTVLFLGNMSVQPVPGCQRPGYLAPHAARLASCVALSQGFPVHYLSAVPTLALDHGGKVTAANLSLFANAVIDKGAAAEDLAAWMLTAGTVMYALWLPFQRPAPSADAAQAVAKQPLIHE